MTETNLETSEAGREVPEDSGNSPGIDLGTYSEMFAEYVAASPWISAADAPLVFHLRKLCVQLDSTPDAPAAVSSAYLQAFSRLDKRRPGAPTGGASDPDQTSIFDHLDD